MGNAATRLDLYRQAEAILAGDVPVLPLTYARWYVLIKPRVTSFPMSAVRRWFLKDVVVDPAWRGSACTVGALRIAQIRRVFLLATTICGPSV
jgi:hypothetical protein